MMAPEQVIPNVSPADDEAHVRLRLYDYYYWYASRDTGGDAGGVRF